MKNNFSHLYFYICSIRGKQHPECSKLRRRSLTYEGNNSIDNRISWIVFNGYDVLVAEADTAEEAKKIIEKFIKKQKEVDVSILPTILNFLDLRDIINTIRCQARIKHYINSRFYSGREELKITRLQYELQRSISKNEAWTRKLKKLEEKTQEYKKKPNKALKLDILSDMHKLGIDSNGMIV